MLLVTLEWKLLRDTTDLNLQKYQSRSLDGSPVEFQQLLLLLDSFPSTTTEFVRKKPVSAGSEEVSPHCPMLSCFYFVHFADFADYAYFA